MYRFTFRPKGDAVKVLVRYGDQLLLVRPAYSHRLWTVPGGAMERAEIPEQAARREVKEETGLALTSLRPIGDYKSTRHYIKETVHCFTATTENGQLTLDPIEIQEAQWFKSTELPADRTPRVDILIDLYRRAE